MIPIKDLSIQDLKDKFLDRIGFVFVGASPSSDEACQRLCDTLIQKGTAKGQPEFMVKHEGNTTYFVYPETGGLDCPEFYAKGKVVEQLGFCQIDILGAYLKNK